MHQYLTTSLPPGEAAITPDFNLICKPFFDALLAYPFQLDTTLQRIDELTAFCVDHGIALNDLRFDPQLSSLIMNNTLLSLVITFDKTSNGGMAASDRSAVMEKLIEVGFDPNAKDIPFGWSPLHHTASHLHHLEHSALLIRHGAQVNLPNSLNPSHTPFHVAVLSGEEAQAQLLMSHGGDLQSLAITEHSVLGTPRKTLKSSMLALLDGALLAQAERQSIQDVLPPPQIDSVDDSKRGPQTLRI